MYVENSSDPKYLIIAKTLRGRISEGEYEVGQTMPTEVQLSEEFSASKQTIRNALRMLQQWGLTFSRRGSGTIVRSKGGQECYTQDVGTMADLLQYQPSTFLANLQYEEINLSKEEAELIESQPGAHWWKVNARRFPQSGTKADGFLNLYFRDSHRNVIDLLAATPTAHTHALLQEGYGEVVQEVWQRIEPCILSDEIAEKMMVETGTAGLRVVRRYYGAGRKMIWAAIVYHPPGFSYDSTFNRQVR